jgi:hypothetical protein
MLCTLTLHDSVRGILNEVDERGDVGPDSPTSAVNIKHTQEIQTKF